MMDTQPEMIFVVPTGNGGYDVVSNIYGLLRTGVVSTHGVSVVARVAHGLATENGKKLRIIAPSKIVDQLPDEGVPVTSYDWPNTIDDASKGLNEALREAYLDTVKKHTPENAKKFVDESRVALHKAAHKIRGMPTFKKIKVNEQCDHRLAHAIESFQCAVIMQAGAEGRRLPARSVANLCHHHLLPALVTAVDCFTNATGARDLLDHCASPQGIERTFSQPFHFHHFIDRLYKFLQPSVAGRGGAKLEATIDTLKEVAFFLACWPRPKKVTTREDHGLRGGRQRLRSTQRRLWLAEWPYCESCWKLTETAYRLERDAAKTKSSDHHEGLSDRFCAEHARMNGSLYRRDQKNKPRFRNLLEAIYDEISSDVAYRERFTSSRDDEIWQKAKSMSPEDLYKLASRDLPSFNLLQMRVRLVAYKIACHSRSLIECVVAIKKMQRSALVNQGVVMTMSEIGLHFGVTKQEVSRRLKALGGCIDFNAQNELLRWWPFDGLAGRDVVNVGNRKSDAAADEWSAPIERYLQEIYSDPPEPRTASIKVQALLV